MQTEWRAMQRSIQCITISVICELSNGPYHLGIQRKMSNFYKRFPIITLELGIRCYSTPHNYIFPDVIARKMQNWIRSLPLCNFETHPNRYFGPFCINNYLNMTHLLI